MRKSHKQQPTKWDSISDQSASGIDATQREPAYASEDLTHTSHVVELFVKNRTHIELLNHLLRICDNLSIVNESKVADLQGFHDYSRVLATLPQELQTPLLELNVADASERKQIIQAIELQQHRLLKENKTFLKSLNDESLMNAYQQRIDFIEMKHRVEKLRELHFHTDIDALVSLTKAVAKAARPHTLEKSQRLLDKWQNTHPRLMAVLSTAIATETDTETDMEQVSLSAMAAQEPQKLNALCAALKSHLQARMTSLSSEELQILDHYCQDHLVYEHVDLTFGPPAPLRQQPASTPRWLLPTPVQGLNSTKEVEHDESHARGFMNKGSK